VRKSLGVAGLLALLVLPLTGSAGATLKPAPPQSKTVCAWVKAAADVKAGANIGLFGTLLKKHPLDVHAKANVDGDVYIKVCVTVENVVVTLDVNGLLNVGESAKCGKNGIDLRAIASLATGATSGTVAIDVKVKVLAGGTLVTDPAQLDADAIVKAFAKIDLAPFKKLDAEVLADLDLCIDVDAGAGVEVGGGDDDPKH